MTPADREALARLLTTARREGQQVAALPAHLVPENADEAYAVQARVAALLGWPPLGWKIAGTNDVMRARLRQPEPILGRSADPCRAARSDRGGGDHAAPRP